MGFRQPLTRLSELIADIFKTASSGARIEISAADASKIRFYSGDPAETAPASVSSYAEAGDGILQLLSPGYDEQSAASVILSATDGAGSAITATASQVEVTADAVVLSAFVQVAGDLDVLGSLSVGFRLVQFGPPDSAGAGYRSMFIEN